MMAVSSIVLVGAYGCLVFLKGFFPKQPAMSLFEVKRRLGQKDAQASSVYARWQSVDDVMAIVTLLRTVVMVFFACFAVVYFGWLAGSFIAFVGLVSSRIIAAKRPVIRLFERPYQKLESKLFAFAKQYQASIRPLRAASIWNDKFGKLSSKAELLHLVQEARFLSAVEKRQLAATLELNDKIVESVMVAYEDITTVSQHDLMGPLLLHELHQTGHDTFVVVESAESMNVVGTIAISRLLTLEDKTSHKVKYFMNTHFPRFEKNTPISECIATFAKDHEFMGVIYDQKGVCGVVTLEGCLRIAFGRELDE